MVRKDIVILDNLSDPPIFSPTTLSESGQLNNLPPSALAERIFNDPEAWRLLGDDADYDEAMSSSRLPLDEKEMEEELAWLENEIKRFSMPIFGEAREGPGLPDDDPTIPPSPGPLQASSVSTITEHQDLNVPKSAQGKGRVGRRPGPTNAFPAYVHDPPGGLDAPRLNNDGTVRSISIERLLNDNMEPQNHFGAHLAHILGDEGDETRPIMVTTSEQSRLLSPPSSESSSSSCSSTGGGFNPPNSHPSTLTHNSITPLPLSSGLEIPPPSTASSIISPFKVHSASTTLSFLEWKGIYPDSLPLAKTRAPGDGQISMNVLTPSASATLGWHLPPQTLPSLDVPGGNINGGHHDARDVPRSSAVNGSADAPSHETLPQSSGSQIPGTSGTCGSDPFLSYRSRNFSLPEVPKKDGMIDTTARRRQGTPLLRSRESPKPAPVVPLPDIPSQTPPPVPPKDILQHATTISSKRSKGPIRRLPAIPTKSAISTTESELTLTSSPMAYTPPPIPPHTSVHAPPCSSNDKSPHPKARRLRTPLRPTHRFNTSITSTPTPSPPPITARSPPCPAGPRSRGCGNTTAPIKPGWQKYRDANNSTPVVLNPPMTMVTVSRSVSAPRGLPRHVHSKSE